MRPILAPLLIAAACLAAPSGPAGAATQTITFDGGCDAEHHGERIHGREGSITFSDLSAGLYGHCGDSILLGDDGWYSRNHVEADPGVRFDVLGVDIGGSRNVVRIPGGADMDGGKAWMRFADGGGTVPDSFGYLVLQGFRDGVETARLEWDPMHPDLSGLEGFTDLDRLEFRLSVTHGAFDEITQHADGDWYTCASHHRTGFGRCDSVHYDNLRLDVSAPAPVPCPAVRRSSSARPGCWD